MALSTLRKGECGFIHRIKSHGDLARRIRDMGILPGTRITVLGRAPLGDPLALRVADTTVALRKQEAATIFITN
ncbi:MAG: ferrous iron transport protein A [Desulfovibrionaceae bacterium]|nr:ferrous iron transport protein A [Desulfovibrionaceae bacterium]